MRRIVMALSVICLTSWPLFAPNRQDKCFWIEQYLNIFDNLAYAEVLAKTDVESSSRERAVRFEKRLGCRAMGPMQVTESTLYLIDPEMPSELLLTWEYGLYFGMRHLSNLKRAYNGNTLKAFAAYNKGAVKYNRRGKFVNQRHVNRCVERLEYWEQILEKAGIS